MFPNVDPTTTKAWKLLSSHYEEMKQTRMKELFSKEPDRFISFSLKCNYIF